MNLMIFRGRARHWPQWQRSLMGREVLEQPLDLSSAEDFLEVVSLSSYKYWSKKYCTTDRDCLVFGGCSHVMCQPILGVFSNYWLWYPSPISYFDSVFYKYKKYVVRKNISTDWNAMCSRKLGLSILHVGRFWCCSSSSAHKDLHQVELFIKMAIWICSMFI